MTEKLLTGTVNKNTKTKSTNQDFGWAEAVPNGKVTCRIKDDDSTDTTCSVTVGDP